MLDTLEVDTRHYPRRSEHAAACSICTAVINSAEILIKSKITDIEGEVSWQLAAHEHSNMSSTKDGMKLNSQPRTFVHSIFKIIFKSWNPSETWFLMPLWWIFIKIMNTKTNRVAGMILTLSISQLLNFTSCNPPLILFFACYVWSRGSRSFRWR